MTTNVLSRTAIAAVGLTAVTVSALLGTAGASNAGDKETLGSGRTLTASLSGANEVGAGGALGVGDPDGAGQATVTINPGTGQLCGKFAWQQTGPLAGLHIHEAAAGQNGSIVVPLDPADQGGSQNQQCVTITRELAKEIIKDPGAYYVNMHTNNPAPNNFPAGAVRGQLSK